MAMVIAPVIGQIYRNANGFEYCCDSIDEGVPLMVRLRDGWTIKAHVVYQEDNGEIHWSYSTGGHWRNGYGD